MRRLVTEVEPRDEDYKGVIFLENEIICIDRFSNMAITALLDEEEELQLLRHIVALVNAELEQRLAELSTKLSDTIKERDEKLKQLEGGVFDSVVEVEVDTMALINKVNELDELIKEYKHAIDRLATFNEYLEKIGLHTDSVIEIYRKNHLWV